MSDILIRGMEMPKDEPLLVKINPDGAVSTTAKNGYKKYEAVPLPPHGRLIDADALKKVIANAKHMDAHIYDGKIRTMYSDHLCIGADYDDVCAAIDETPTIIPAEEVTKV